MFEFSDDKYVVPSLLLLLLLNRNPVYALLLLLSVLKIR